MKGLRIAIPLLLALLLGVLAVLIWLPAPVAPPSPTAGSPAGPGTFPTAEPVAPTAPTSVPEDPGPLSELAPPPDWENLAAEQSTLTSQDFVRLMDKVFSVSAGWRDWFHLGDDDVLIETGVPNESFQLRFASDTPVEPTLRYWRPAAQLGEAPEGLPLEGVRIAIDPGHIGGRWATIEERWFQVGDAVPVKEGDLTLLVAMLLRPQLEELGAEVSLVRDTTEPVTSLRPEDLMPGSSSGSGEGDLKLAERLFYRSAEIRARALRVNETIQPDLVVCLHFNAEAWGDPASPALVENNHFHLLVNGAYMGSELALADQRFELTHRLVSRTHAEELALARSVAAAFVRGTGLPPYLYEVDSSRALNVDGNPYIWARNLLANRLYHCPVVFLEPYVMNSVEDHARIQAGDYEGLREVLGTRRPSIFREYADSVVRGLADHYRVARNGAPAEHAR